MRYSHDTFTYLFGQFCIWLKIQWFFSIKDCWKIQWFFFLLMNSKYLTWNCQWFRSNTKWFFKSCRGPGCLKVVSIMSAARRTKCKKKKIFFFFYFSAFLCKKACESWSICIPENKNTKMVQRPKWSQSCAWRTEFFFQTACLRDPGVDLCH